MRTTAYIFPGQGAQYPGMGKDFYNTYPIYRQTLEEVDDLLKENISELMINGPEDQLKQTKNSQIAIFAMSIGIYRVLNTIFPELNSQICAGLSLGEYSALAASQKISFQECLMLVQKRGQLMNDACMKTEGAMAVVMGLDASAVETLVRELHLPDDLWIANYNCPGQVVISGTISGIEKGAKAALEQGAKRVLPLQVHGAFHSGLMKFAEEQLRPYIEKAPFQTSDIKMVMNVPGDFVDNTEKIKQYLIEQVTHSVKWEQGVRAIENSGVDVYMEIGPGKTLAGMNKRIGVGAPTISLEKVEDFKLLEQAVS